MTAASQFPKAASGGLHVGGSIVSLHKGCIEQRAVEFREFCWLESASPRNPHQCSRLGRHGIDHGQLHPIGFKADSQKFCAKHIQVKLQVVPYHEGGLAQGRLERVEGYRQRMSLRSSKFGTDSMNFLGTKGYVESLWANKVVASLD